MVIRKKSTNKQDERNVEDDISDCEGIVLKIIQRNAKNKCHALDITRKTRIKIQ